MLHKLTDGQKKLWLLLVQTKKEQARLDLQIRHTEFEFMDVPEPPLIIEGLKDQYARASIKRHAVNVILFASLGYEFENLRKSNDQNTFREGGLIVMEKKLPSPPTAVLLIHVEEDPQ
ncbi:MAG: hypothetical protein A2122_01405 [Candidatus Liptonbacteria bacterium GWB1_49_6]|uniref:Uncharacterized protein n=1 Tax=Candidatus Liptonbacteria bacterium GWB1_49_6 TaxID=1798644 RepID=A0A1G2C6X7_9BACT|nr:MAG: hypothetical protein A2122_01405 [Candidatus Liptonbacteria bacterium GWB1_49_6]